MHNRLFIAFPVPQEIKEKIRKIQENLKKNSKLSRFHWSKIEDTHVTVLFLGNIEEEKKSIIEQAMIKVLNNYRSFSFSLSDLSAFPNSSIARVLIIKIGSDSQAPFSINQELSKLMIENNITIEQKPWKPHLTLGRTNYGYNIQDELDNFVLEKIAWKAEKIELIKSELFSDGPKYTILNSVSLL